MRSFDKLRMSGEMRWSYEAYPLRKRLAAASRSNR